MLFRGNISVSHTHKTWISFKFSDNHPVKIIKEPPPPPPGLVIRLLKNWWREQGWCSGESTRLPPTWPGLDSRSWRHMWVEFIVGSSPCSESFFSGYSGFRPTTKKQLSKFQFDPEAVKVTATSSQSSYSLYSYSFHIPFNEKTYIAI